MKFRISDFGLRIEKRGEKGETGETGGRMQRGTRH
jgi:hypothetical protein